MDYKSKSKNINATCNFIKVPYTVIHCAFSRVYLKIIYSIYAMSTSQGSYDDGIGPSNTNKKWKKFGSKGSSHRKGTSFKDYFTKECIFSIQACMI